MLKQDQGRDVINRLLATGELDRSDGGRKQADLLIHRSREDLTKAARLRVKAASHPDLAHEAVHGAVSNALSAILEAQGLRPGFRGGRRGAFEPACRQAVYDAVSAQLTPPYGEALALAGRLCREQAAHEYEYAPMPAITVADLDAAAAILYLAERLLDEMSVF